MLNEPEGTSSVHLCILVYIICVEIVYIYICIRCMYIPTIYIYKAAADASLCLMHYIYGGKTNGLKETESNPLGWRILPLGFGFPPVGLACHCPM